MSTKNKKRNAEFTPHARRRRPSHLEKNLTLEELKKLATKAKKRKKINVRCETVQTQLEDVKKGTHKKLRSSENGNKPNLLKLAGRWEGGKEDKIERGQTSDVNSNHSSSAHSTLTKQFANNAKDANSLLLGDSSLSYQNRSFFHVPVSFLGPLFCCSKQTSRDMDMCVTSSTDHEFLANVPPNHKAEVGKQRLASKSANDLSYSDNRFENEAEEFSSKSYSLSAEEIGGDSGIDTTSDKLREKKLKDDSGKKKTKVKAPREISSKEFRSLQSKRIALISHGVFTTGGSLQHDGAYVSLAPTSTYYDPDRGLTEQDKRQNRAKHLAMTPSLFGFGAQSRKNDFTARDPRFSSFSGEYNESKFMKAYSFIDDLRKEEVKRLQNAVEKGRFSFVRADSSSLGTSSVMFDGSGTTKPTVEVVKLNRNERENAKRQLQSLESQEIARKRLGQRKDLRRRVTKEECERIALTGKKPFFFSESTLKKAGRKEARGKADGQAGRAAGKKYAKSQTKKEIKLMQREKRKGLKPPPRRSNGP